MHYLARTIQLLTPTRVLPVIGSDGSSSLPEPMPEEHTLDVPLESCFIVGQVISIYVNVCMYIYTCMHTDDAHIHAYVHVYIYINLFTPVSTCICVNGTIYTQVHIHINTTMYIYTHTSLEMLQLCRFRPWMLTLFRSCTQSSHRLPARRPDVLQLLRIGFRV